MRNGRRFVMEMEMESDKTKQKQEVEEEMTSKFLKNLFKSHR